MTKVFTAIGKIFYEAFRVDEPRKIDPRWQYPDSVKECINEELKYKSGTYAAIKKYRASGPWKGTLTEQESKMRLLNYELAKVYKIPEPRLVFVDKFPSGPCCFPTSNPAVIMMQPVEETNTYSVVAYLHEFGHAMGKGERATCIWSLNLFKRFWPKTFNNLDQVGHMLYRKKKED